MKHPYCSMVYDRPGNVNRHAFARLSKFLPCICLLLLLLFGCGRDASQETDAPEMENPEYSSWDEDVEPIEPATFSKEMMLEDYESFWSQIEEDCPLLQAFYQKKDINPEEFKQKYRARIEALQDGDLEGFSNAMLYMCSAGFHSFGHISLVSATQYDLVMSNSDIANPNIVRMMDNSKAKTYYKWAMDLPENQALREQKAGGIEKRSEDEIDKAFAVFLQNAIKVETHEQTPYICIRSFTTPLGTEDKVIAYIQNFCESNFEADNIIIDIRGNSGGSDAIWREGLKPLFRGKELHWDTFAGFYQTERNRLNWGEGWPEKDPSIRIISSEELMATGLFSNGDFQQLSSMDGIIVKTNQIKGEEGEEYQGQIWLLIDSSNFSATESFVQFCKRSGFATTVGNQTRGNGTMIKDPAFNYIVLPNSGMMASFVPFYGLNDDGTCNEVEGSKPDIEVCDAQDALEVCLSRIREKNKF